MRRYLTLNLLLTAFTLFMAACDGGGEPEPQTPAVPTNVTATPGPGYVTVSWDDNSTGETGFVIYRDTVATNGLTSQALSKVGEVGADTETFIDRDITIGQAYVYSVTARNSEDESAQADAEAAAEVEAGVDLMVGTNNRRFGEANGTIFTVLFVFPEGGLPGENASVTITGPSGWNGGEAITYTVGPQTLGRGWLFNSFNGIDAQTGTYTLEVDFGGTAYQANAQLPDPSYKYPRPQNIRFTESSPAEVTVTWDAPERAQSTFVSLWRGNYEEQVGNYERTEGNTHTFSNLTLEDGLYQVEVAPLPINLADRPVIKAEPFGISYDTANFAIGACAQVLDLPGTFFKVDPAGTYLNPSESDLEAKPATSLRLADLGISPGDCIGLERAGAFQAGTDLEDESESMAAVFRGASGFIATENTQPVDFPICGDIFAEDIAEDFNVSSTILVVVPEGAEEILFSTSDCFFGDNSDPNSDYGVLLRH